MPTADGSAVLHTAPDSVFVLGPEGTVQYANEQAAALLGVRPEETVGISALDLVHPDDLAVVISSMGTVQGKSVGTPVEVRVHNCSGQWRWMEVLGADRLDVPGVEGIVCVARDITERRMWEVAAGDVTRFQQVVQHAPSITLLLDEAGLVTSVNGAFTRLLGHDPSLVVGRSLAAFATADGGALLRDALERVRRGSHHVSVEVPMRAVSRDARERPVRFEFTDLLEDPVVAGIVVTGYDVSELETARRELEYLAQHDALTGLANRALLLATMRSRIDERLPMAVIFMDLDRFKPVNDLLGHEAGDELLRAVADRIGRTVRPGDLVARVGGDEFVVVAPGITGRSLAAALGARIEAAIAEPFMLAAGPVRIGVSVGLAVADGNSTVAGLLADADLNMYDIKADRRGDAARPVAERRRSADQRRRLADDLAAGLGRGEVVAHLQPIVELATGRIRAYEALARWFHPELGLLFPSSFIDLAEVASLDGPLGDAVLESAVEALVALRAQDPAAGDARLAVNLSVGQLCDRELVGRVGTVLEVAGLGFEALVIEVTERTTLARRAMAGGVSPEETLFELRRLGAALSLDDFGTGYSSLTHVRRYPLEYLKIDRSFVAGMVENEQDRAVVAAVIGLAAAVGIRVIAEGVETAEQLDALAALGCHEAQGYLIAPPMSTEDARIWTRSRQLIER